MSIVGIIANPASGKDLRRLVASAATVTHTEKINTLVRMLRALDALGVGRALIAPDPGNLGERAREIAAPALRGLHVEPVPLPWTLGTRSDSERAAAWLRDNDAACIIVLGGDGTSRAVAAHCGEVPLLAVSTGTNNAFPRMIEGTLAGMAAACIARLPDAAAALSRAPLLRLLADGECVSHALVDVAVIDTLDIGGGAVWESAIVRELFLAQARVDSIGLSAIGGVLDPLPPGCDCGLHLLLAGTTDAGATRLTAALGPGLMAEVAVERHRRFAGRFPVETRRGVFALDGEREFLLDAARAWEVEFESNGPRVVNVETVLAIGVANGLFRRDPLPDR